MKRSFLGSHERKPHCEHQAPQKSRRAFGQRAAEFERKDRLVSAHLI
jgi:hypothetical protein